MKKLLALITALICSFGALAAAGCNAGGGSDGNHMAVQGIPVVDGCGPAGGKFHTDQEFLRIDTIEERIQMIVNLFKRL